MNQLPLSELIKSAAEAAFTQTKNRPRYTPLAPHCFPAPMLSKYLYFANLANVPYVPGEIVGTLEIEKILRFDEANFPGVEETLRNLAQLNSSIGHSEMLRWDCCAGSNLKFAMANAVDPKIEYRWLEVDDPRAYDILYEYPSDTINVIKRPWINAMVVDGYPVEFRVFVENRSVIGISNYYVQRPLPIQMDILEYAKTAVINSMVMIAAISLSDAHPAMPKQEVMYGDVSMTLDFIVDHTGQVLLLEGGPSYKHGAHPCCFLQHDNTIKPIDGLMLSVDGEPIPLSSII